MWPLRRKPTPTLERTSERELIGLACGGSGAAFREIMRRNNRRLFRAARGIIGTDWEAEEVVQDAYGESVQNALVADDKSVTGGVIVAGTLFGISQLIGYLTGRANALSVFWTGRRASWSGTGM